VARWGSALASVIHRPGARSGGDRAIVPRLQRRCPYLAKNEAIMLDAFLTNCRLADGRVVDIGIADGKIAIVGEGAAP
jgi:hypothetical protein